MLEAYRAKRDFKVTAEPRGDEARTGGDAFVIQKHAARRLHYDFRIELDGVMKSWAVARGPSLVPGEKRLAVHTEDHPIEYNEFEGTIPKGEYGGGTVMIWDRGRWIPEGDPHAGYAKGHLDFRLEGEKLSGSWHLVRLKKRPGERQESWLLIKSNDETARGPDDPDILEEQALSVVSGRSLDEIAAGAPSKRAWSGKADAQWSSNGTPETRAPARKAGALENVAILPPEAEPPAPPPKKARAKEGAAKPVGATKAPKLAERKSRRKAGPDVGGVPVPDFVEPCLALLRDEPPPGPGWLHEVKFDGYRMQARLAEGRVTLKTRKALDWTDRFRPVADAIARLSARGALIDGEIVVETAKGVSSFTALQEELKNGGGRFSFYVFDLLHLDGRDLTPLPLADRKAALKELLRPLPADAAIKLSEDFPDEGAVLLKHACQMGLEGVISKRRDAPYRPGRNGDWAKAKCANRQEFVVLGYAPSTVDPRAVGALLLGYYEDGALRYAGRVGTGYTAKTARELWERLEPLRRTGAPLKPLPAEERKSRGARWVEPQLVVEIEFRGWTGGERIRQGAFKGVREDKPATEVVREGPDVPASAGGEGVTMPTTKEPEQADGAAAARPASPRKKAVAVTASQGAVRLTNPDRVYWDDVRLTKQGLADYYTEVWDWIAPHVVGRALSLVRCPEGALKHCFFQKHASAGLDSKFLRLFPEDEDHVISIADRDGLISLVQAGVLEIHVRGSTVDHLKECNRVVFDLDPGPGVDWTGVRDAARVVKARLDTLGLVSFLKTSGGKGLHVVVPIAFAPWDAVKPFVKSVAQAIAADDPAHFTAIIAKKERPGRVFIDYLRNSREATAIAPYSTRSRPGATVSVPITWDELGKLPEANHYTVANLPKRLARLKRDPWADIAEMTQPLPPPLKGNWSK